MQRSQVECLYIVKIFNTFAFRYGKLYYYT